MKINRIFAVLMAVIFIGSQPMAVLAEDVPNETENVSNETEELLNETEDIANETENVSDEAETVSDETAESEGLRDQSGFVENSFRYSNGQPIQKRSAGAYAISDTSNAYKKINGVCYNSQGEPVERAIGKVIDVSEHNQDIDWEKVKNSDVDFAILRVGYGNDVSYQDDKKWQYNVSECTRLGIPFGVYIYSYAENTTEAESEADHVLRLIKGYNLAYPVYYDLEDNSQVSLGNDTIQKFAETFCNKISNAGYQVGVYANLNWWNNYLTGSVYNNWHRWVAQYNYQCDYNGNYDMWQCTSKAQVDGISTDVDVSFYYGDLLSDADVNTPVVEVGDTDLISYCANIQNDGWTDWKKNGHALGTIGKSLRLEALKIQTNSENLGVSYTGLVAGYGWTDEVQTGAMLGTEGQSRALEAIKLNLTGDDAENYDIYYRVHSSNFGWLGWAKNGEKAGTEEYGYAIEAVQIAVLPKGSAAPGETADAYRFNEEWNNPSVKYTAHVQNVGWQPTCCNQETAGTTGQNKRIEAIKIWLTGEIEEEYDVYYRVHVQNFGWLDWAKNGEIAGTVNYGYRMEAIKIALVRKDGEGLTPVGTSSKTFDTQAVYSAHVQNIGWQDEVYNGETIGTVGQGLRMEALKLDLYKPLYSGDVTYSAHIQNIGWQDWKKDGEISGTVGEKLQMEAVKIKLTGEMKVHYDIYYRAQVQNLGWLDWVKNGEEAGTTGKGYRLESLEIKLVPKTEG